MNHQQLARNATIGFIILVALAALLYLGGFIEIDLETLMGYGLLGLFIASVIANASVFLPLPMDVVVLLVAEVYNPWVLALIVGVGSALGEMSAYLVGRGGQKVLSRLSQESENKLSQVSSYISNGGLKGAIFIALGAFTPFPFDLIGLAAGLIRYNPLQFFGAAVVGKFFRYLLIAYAGLLGITALKAFFGLA